ncbi:hypothetical protein PC129_g13771 [Phytophthora cactorum]|uniref:Uncharacterized protein n=1 Tax=Phytophthora cactorum TaxID=29920 RepID=A0A8T1HTZ1_9STRA|nr:hypothetical protein PC129_g13771 [Phytophthora cactorum]
MCGTHELAHILILRYFINYIARGGPLHAARDAYRWAERRSCAPRSVTKLCAQDLLTLTLSLKCTSNTRRPPTSSTRWSSAHSLALAAINQHFITVAVNARTGLHGEDGMHAPSRSMVVRPLRWSVQRVNNIGAGILQQEVYADPRNDVLT